MTDNRIVRLSAVFVISFSATLYGLAQGEPPTEITRQEIIGMSERVPALPHISLKIEVDVFHFNAFLATARAEVCEKEDCDSSTEGAELLHRAPEASIRFEPTSGRGRVEQPSLKGCAVRSVDFRLHIRST